MAGLIEWALAGAAEGGGKQGVDVAKTQREFYNQQEHEKFKNELAAQRETALEELRQRGSMALEDKRHGNAVTLERDVRQPFQAQQQKEQFAFTRGENELNRNLSIQLEDMREKAADRRHAESMRVQMAHVGIAQQQLKLAQEKVTLLPQADGTMVKVTQDGRNLGVLADADGKPVMGVKDLSSAAKVMVETYQKALSAVERDIQNEMDPAAKQVLREKRDFYVKAVEQLTGYTDQKAPAGGRPPLSSFGPGGAAKPKDAGAGAGDAGDRALGRAPTAPPATPAAPSSNPLDDQYQREQAEMESGKRRAYSPEVVEYLNSSSNARRQGNQALADRERERALRESRVISGR